MPLGKATEVVASLVVAGGLACTWCASTQFSRAALSGHKDDFSAPYFLMWFHTNLIVSCYPVYLLSARIRKMNLKEAHAEAQLVFGEAGLCFWSIVKYVLPFLFLWTGANYLYARCLSHVSASIATSISSGNAAMVYVLAIFILSERFHMQKAFAVILGVGGIVLISIDPSDKSDGQWVGYVLAVVSAFFSALYKVIFKKVIGDATLSQVSLFMTCLGFLNLTINVIPAFVLAYTVETLKWAYVPWGFIFGGAILALMFDFLINFGIALLNPLVISVGMLVGIPVNTAVDMVRGKVSTDSWYIYVGTILVILSFMLIVVPWQYNPACLEKPDEEKEKDDSKMDSSFGEE
ncbi:unnamed protein product, partial [Mesorhabditis belari]|uniref:EamA domain-containing protein n=1 Tax=Mesorhabditis belari TaxID=2138241 RepID=A0AAF3EGW0_9BILA